MHLRTRLPAQNILFLLTGVATLQSVSPQSQPTLGVYVIEQQKICSDGPQRFPTLKDL
jgi:hypothetical protein